jgi:predicted HicB family RNase H-like nuclease
MKRATIYLEEELHRALKLKSLEADQSISHLVNDAIRTTLAEDLEDLSDVKERQSEKTLSYEDFLKELKSRGQI